VLSATFAVTPAVTQSTGETPVRITLTLKFATHTNSPGRYYDTHPGLHLWVKSPKQKYWIFRSSHGGRRTDLSLGAFPAVGVADARREASALAAQVREGIDPRAERRREKADQDPPKLEMATFNSFALEFIATKSPEWRNDKHAQQWVNTITTYASPVIGTKTLDAITTEDILKILNPIWRTKTETATRVRGRLEAIFSAAKAMKLRSGENPAQWKGHLAYLLPQPEKISKVEHFRALPYTQVPAFVTSLHARVAMAALSLEFLILTAARSGEVLFAKREEVQDTCWTIPGDRMKAGREHRVPLCSRALALIARAKELNPDSEYLFSLSKRPMSNMVMTQLLRRMDAGVTAHGFRSSFRDWVSEETQHSREVAEMALAHTIENKVESAYRRGNLFEKRRKLMQDWEDYCLGQQSKTNLNGLSAA